MTCDPQLFSLLVVTSLGHPLPWFWRLASNLQNMAKEMGCHFNGYAIEEYNYHLDSGLFPPSLIAHLDDDGDSLFWKSPLGKGPRTVSSQQGTGFFQQACGLVLYNKEFGWSLSLAPGSSSLSVWNLSIFLSLFILKR